MDNSMGLLGLAIFLGHCVGDYIFQNDYLAKWKTAKAGTTMPEEDTWVVDANGDPRLARISYMESLAYWRPSFACLVHCILYTFAMFLVLWPHFSLPWWFYAVVFAAHYPVDRFRLARRFMTWNRQEEFATGVFSPWSIIVIDNIIHLLVAYEAACFALLW